MEYSRLNTINTDVEKLKNKEIEFSQIRPELETEEIKEEEISLCLNQIDKEFQLYLIQQEELKQGKNLFWGGVILTVFCVLFSAFAIYKTQIEGVLFKAIIPILFSVGLTLRGLSKMK